MKYAAALRAIRQLIKDRQYVRITGSGPEVEAKLDLFFETMSVLDYDTDFFPGAEIPLITNDSRAVVPGAIFAAIRGAKTDGNQFIPQAVAAGAAVTISAVPVAEPVPGVIHLQVSDDYDAYARLCEAFHDFPTRAMPSFAVTGTNGKTTSAMLFRQLLNLSGRSCGLISTVEYDTCDGTPLAADRTTPEAARLFELFASMRDHGARAMAMEVSSHALAQNRIGALRFQAAIFTNLTGDHLDYHRTMEAYFAAKCRLFTDHLASGGVAVINADDAWGRQLCAMLPPQQAMAFGRNHGNWRIADIVLGPRGSDFVLQTDTLRQEFHTNLIGEHNIYNVAGVVLALHGSGLMPLAESAALTRSHALAVPGRLEMLALPNGATAFVDYAHTDDALSNVLHSLRALNPRRILTVFGAGGDRDRTKRPRMGKVAAELSDELFITSDNPRTEDPEAIIAMIAAGLPPSGPVVHRITDRAAAIAAALNAARPGDMVLIAGKGHEPYQEIAGVQHHFDDREVVRSWRPAKE